MEQEDKKLLTPMEIETLFDSGELHLVPDDKWLPRQKELFAQIAASHFQLALKNCEEIFATETSVINKVFSIQWAVAISEVIYDLQLRSLWLKKWQGLSPHPTIKNFSSSGSWTSIFWCQYIYRDQKALGYYFSSNFSEAKKIFEQNLSDSRRHNYSRGEMRSLFHLGLINKCLRETDKALFSWQKALEIARKAQALKFMSRIEEQLSLLAKDDISFDTMFKQVEDLLLKKNFRAARKLSLFLCKVRRFEKRTWFAKSEYLLLALVSYAYQRYSAFNAIFEKISDPVLKIKVLDIVKKISPLDESLQFEHRLLCYSLGVEDNSDTSVFYEGLNWGSPENSDVAALVQALSQSPGGLNKENITKFIWKTNDYDPTYHDQKIYRLINKIRKMSGRPDIISNHYNYYKIS